MNKKVKVALIILVVILVGAGGFLGVYRWQRVQGEIKSYTINLEAKDKKNSQKVVIYTQDREFKNNVLTELKKELSGQNIYVQVEPIEEILSNKLADWDKVLIFSTVQSSEPPVKVLEYIDTHKDDEKLGIFLTADSGSWAHEPADVEAITAASKNDNKSMFSNEMLAFIKNKN
ncbi:hypothetical protein ACWOFR_15290 [Carnobacterium gallinarum]|uniref:hypothetical protein n=1 Tax=Carnobacterium gallinarum TaxID=2749 RepID=UPI00055346E1|nr:hypothetical protein [Carnobacterium gallinarum]